MESRLRLLIIVIIAAVSCQKSDPSAPPLDPIDLSEELTDLSFSVSDISITDTAVADKAASTDLTFSSDLRCTPNCTDKECGDDGCGGSCGMCTSPKRCDIKNKCTCVPNCSGMKCGSDGCGGSCGMCPTGELCDEFPGNFISCGSCYPNTDDLDKLCRCHCKCSGGDEVYGTCIHAMMTCAGCRQYCDNFCTSRIPRQTVVSRCGTCTG